MQTILHPDETVFDGLLSSSLFFCPLRKVKFVRLKKTQQVYTVTLQFPNGVTRTVQVKAASREVAEARALKRNRNATGVKR